jgi:hypothetical protein
MIIKKVKINNTVCLLFFLNNGIIIKTCINGGNFTLYRDIDEIDEYIELSSIDLYKQ